ncbi:MAG: hypothetical protein J3Q66DRAFT_337068, partial [Benniella sp.]
MTGTATSARGAPPAPPPHPSIGTSSRNSSVRSSAVEIVSKAIIIYKNQDLCKYLTGDAPVAPKTNEMLVFVGLPIDTSVFDFAQAACDQIGTTYNCVNINAPNWARKTKDLGIVFEDEAHDRIAISLGIKMGNVTYYPAINLPDNMTFRKYSVTSLPESRNPT